MCTIHCSGHLGGGGICLLVYTSPVHPVDRQTPVKHYLSTTSLAEGKNDPEVT